MNWMREKLMPHRGHKVVCVCYGDWDDPVDICIECEDCGCVLVSAEDYDETGDITCDMAMQDIMNYLNSQSDEWFQERSRNREEVLADKALLDKLAAEHFQCVNEFGCDRAWSCMDACDCDPGIEDDE